MTKKKPHVPWDTSYYAKHPGSKELSRVERRTYEGVYKAPIETVHLENGDYPASLPAASGSESVETPKGVSPTPRLQSIMCQRQLQVKHIEALTHPPFFFLRWRPITNLTHESVGFEWTLPVGYESFKLQTELYQVKKKHFNNKHILFS